jgi:cytochrome P450
MCLGAALVRMELEEVFKALFTRFPELRMTSEPRYKRVFISHGPEVLPVAW